MRDEDTAADQYRDVMAGLEADPPPPPAPRPVASVPPPPPPPARRNWAWLREAAFPLLFLLIGIAILVYVVVFR